LTNPQLKEAGMTSTKVASFAARVVPILIAFVVVAAWPSAVFAQKMAHIGTWKQNFEKSKCDPPATGTRPQSVVRTYEEFEGNGIKATFVTIRADGTRATTSYSAHFDGKAYPYTGSAFDTITLKRIDAYSWFATNKGAKAGNTGTNTVSKDGKTLTYTSKGTNAQGNTISCVSVFDRQ
jgi:hypothetical protein